MKKIILSIFVAVLFMSFLGINSADAKWWVFGKAEDVPEISSLFVGGIEVMSLHAELLSLDSSNLETGMVVIKGFGSKAEAPLAVVKISLDDGQTWEDVPIEHEAFMYQFEPEEDKEYKPRFKIMDTAGAQSDPGDVPRFVLVYKNVDVQQVAEETLRAMIDAYTSKSLSRFSRYIADSFRGDIFALEEAVESDFRRYNSINMDIAVQQVMRSKNEIRVDFEFDWFATKASDGSIVNPARERTNYIFRQEEGGYRLLAMADPVIFGISEASEINTGSPGSETDASSATFGGEDAISPSSPSLTVQTVTLQNQKSIDFSTGTVGEDFEGDMYYDAINTEMRMNFAAVIDEEGTGALEDYTSAATEPGETALDPTAGTVYIVKDNAGNYALMEVTSFASLHIRYKYQTDGTKSFP